MNLNWDIDEDDRSILEFLDKHDIVSTPKVITLETGLDYDKVKNRLRVLNDNGLVHQPCTVSDKLKTRGLYRITDLGSRLLSGDATIGELQRAEEGNDT